MHINHKYLYLLVLFTVVLQSCLTSYKYSYEEENLPSFSGDYRHTKTATDSTLNQTIRVVSFNIKFAQNIEGATSLLLQDPLNSADVILLQEMDEEGTERLAKQMHMNYTYYPATYHPKYRQNVGNAILTKWDIISSKKIKLPHPNSSFSIIKGRNYINRRTATIADIKIQGEIIKFASTHTAVFNTTQHRREVAKALTHEFKGTDAKFGVVGGDFNSLGNADIIATAQSFTSSGFQWASEDVGETVCEKKSFLKPLPTGAFQLDHLFVKGLEVVATGKVDQIGVSDHLPIWVDMEVLRSNSMVNLSSNK